MKRILITLLGLFFAGMFISCQEDKTGFYTGPTAINLSAIGDGVFIKGGEDAEKTFQVVLAVQGEVADYDRVAKFAFGDEHTAVEGTNFELQKEVIIKAGTLSDTIDCKVFRTGLNDDPLMFDLTFDSTGDFVGGVNGHLLIKMMLGFPTQWIDPTGWAAGYAFGECTQAKYAFVFEQLGTLDLTGYEGAWGYLGFLELATQWNEILAANPRPDDDGSDMFFGNK